MGTDFRGNTGSTVPYWTSPEGDKLPDVWPGGEGTSVPESGVDGWEYHPGVEFDPSGGGMEGLSEWMGSLDEIFGAEQKFTPEMLRLQYEMQEEFAPKYLEQQYKMQQKYAPLLMKDQFELEQEYSLKKLKDMYGANLEFAPKFAELEKSINESLYPKTAGLQELLAGQATEGIQSDIPDWMQDTYLSNLKSALGTNIGSPIAADYQSTGLMGLQKDWNDYYRDLGLSVTGRLPLTTAGEVGMPQVNVPQVGTPQIQGTMGWLQGFDPLGAGNLQAQNYATSANLYGNIYGADRGYQTSSNQLDFQKDQSKAAQRNATIGTVVSVVALAI